jgi:hypothetical protein
VSVWGRGASTEEADDIIGVSSTNHVSLSQRSRSDEHRP